MDIERLEPPVFMDIREFISKDGPWGPFNHRVGVSLGFISLATLGYAKNIEYTYAAQEVLSSVEQRYAELITTAKRKDQLFNIITPVRNMN